MRDAIDTMKTLRVLNAEGEKVLHNRTKVAAQSTNKSLQSLKDFHAGHPLLPGMDMEELRGKLVYELSAEDFPPRRRHPDRRKTIAKEENLLRLASHRVQLGGQEKR